MPAIQTVGHFEVDSSKQLGRSSQGNVFCAKDLHTNQLVAAREIWVGTNDEDAIVQVQSEVDRHGRLPHHINIVTYLDSKKNGSDLWIFTEDCYHGDLIKYCAGNTLSMDQMFDIMIQVTTGIQHLHHLDPPVVHGDINPGNIFIANVHGSLVAKLCDLAVTKATEIKENIAQNCEPYCEAQPYMAPELFEITKNGKSSYGISIDIFSLGIFYLTFSDALDQHEMIPPRSKFLLCVFISLANFSHSLTCYAFI